MDPILGNPFDYPQCANALLTTHDVDSLISQYKLSTKRSFIPWFMSRESISSLKLNMPLNSRHNKVTYLLSPESNGKNEIFSTIYLNNEKAGSSTIGRRLKKSAELAHEYHEKHNTSIRNDYYYKTRFSYQNTVLYARKCVFTFVRNPIDRLISGYYTINQLIFGSVYYKNKLDIVNALGNHDIHFYGIIGEPKRFTTFVEELVTKEWVFLQVNPLWHVSTQSGLLTISRVVDSIKNDEQWVNQLGRHRRRRLKTKKKKNKKNKKNENTNKNKKKYNNNKSNMRNKKQKNNKNTNKTKRKHNRQKKQHESEKYEKKTRNGENDSFINDDSRQGRILLQATDNGNMTLVENDENEKNIVGLKFLGKIENMEQHWEMINNISYCTDKDDVFETTVRTQNLMVHYGARKGKIDDYDKMMSLDTMYDIKDKILPAWKVLANDYALYHKVVQFYWQDFVCFGYTPTWQYVKDRAKGSS